MSRGIKLPEELKEWKITSLVSEKNGQNKYRIVKKGGSGEVFANLFHIFAYGSHYSSEKADFYEEEVNFLNSISDKTEYFTCFGAYLYENPSKQKVDMYIATEELEPLSKVMHNKSFTDEEITDFGLQMAEILAFLEENNIFHGNIRPENVFVTPDGRYKLGGFSDFECKISNLDYSAPEVSKDKSPDLTTDIYSVGLIMYCLANDKALPFERGLTTRAEAVKMRIDGAAVTAPKNGSEKLKSIIVIAVQPNNESRWKNAVNMKNALLASCGKLPVESIKAEQEKTNNEAAVGIFDKAEEKDNFNTDVSKKSDKPAEKIQESVNSEAKSNEIEAEKNPPAVNAEANTAVQAPVSEDVFDEYEVSDKPKADEPKAPKKDYGEFFLGIDDNDKANEITKTNSGAAAVPAQKQNTPANGGYKAEKPRKKGLNALIITLSVIIILAVLGFVGYIVYQEVFSEKINNTKPATRDEITTTEAATQPTTAAPTTQPTTSAPEKEIISVVGYDFESAKSKLEDLGFKVAEGNHTYSTLYSEGYVISQTPESGTKAEEGTVITLDISLGEEYVEPTTSAPEESSQGSDNQNSNQSTAENNTFIFANSDSAYISQSDVKNLSDNELEIAINEIYARRGWIFSDAELSAYFNSQAWYTPRYTSSEFSQNVTFNEYEQANIHLILDEQKSRGIR